MTEDLAHRVYSVLVTECSAAADDRSREVFVYSVTERNCREYRFMGSLGFGGKFWPRDMRVSCYREDETDTRTAVLRRTNELLATLSPLRPL